MLRIVVSNRIIPARDLRVVAGRWWNHKLELVATRVILKISSMGVESGCTWWWLRVLVSEDGSPQKGCWFKLIIGFWVTLYYLLFLLF